MKRSSNSSNSPIKYKSSIGRHSTTAGLNSGKMICGAFMVNNENSPIAEEDNSEIEAPKSPMFRLEEYKESKEEYSSSEDDNIIDFAMDSSYLPLSTPCFEEDDPFEITIVKLDKIEVKSCIIPNLLYPIFLILVGAYVIIVI
jgi:hypothetical protein